MAKLDDLDFRVELGQFGKTLQGEIVANMLKLKYRKTGKTIASIVYKAQRFTMSLFAAHYIRSLETGRPPTKNRTAGTPTLKDAILAWLNAGGITPRDGISKDSLAFLISRKIHKEGTLLWRQRGDTRIIKNAVTPARLSTFVNVFGRRFMSAIQSELYTEFNKR